VANPSVGITELTSGATFADEPQFDLLWRLRSRISISEDMSLTGVTKRRVPSNVWSFQPSRWPY